MNNLIWSCPFCSLLCDEYLSNDLQDEDLKLRTFSCCKANDGLSKFMNLKNYSLKAILNGVTVDFDSAVLEASRMLKKSKNSIFCGLGADVGGARSIVKLASKNNAIVDHKHGETMSKTVKSFQTKGLFFTSLSEIKSRADVVIFIGDDCFEKKHCLQKKIANESDTYKKKQFINYGDNFDSSEELIVSLQNLSALQKNKNFLAPTYYNKKFFDGLSGFTYVALVWDPSCYPDDADAIADVLLEITRDLNKNRRGGVLTLAGDEGGTSMQSVMTWMTGLPLRSAFTTRGLRHEPNIFSTKKIIQQNTTDLVVWISCFSSEIPDYIMNIKQNLIVFGKYEISEHLLKKNLENFVFIPVATPGVDTDGHLMRCDGLVTIPLKKITNSPFPSLQKVISRIL